MKQVFAYLLAGITTIPAFAQDNTSVTTHTTAVRQQTIQSAEQFIWSHTNYRTGTNDKPALDFGALDNWMGLGLGVTISSNGKYFAYSLQKINGFGGFDSLIVEATDNTWRMAFAGVTPGVFSGDGNLYIFRNRTGLSFLNTGTDQFTTLDNVASFQSSTADQPNWIACLLKDEQKTLILYHLPTGKQTRFTGVGNYSFDNSGQWLTCQFNNAAKELLLYHLPTGRQQNVANVAGFTFDQAGKALLVKTPVSLLYMSLIKDKTQTIWTAADSSSISSFSFDKPGSQAVFATTGKKEAAIWYWNTRMDKAVPVATRQSAGIAPGLLIAGNPSFTRPDGRYIRFDLQPAHEPALTPEPWSTLVDVWSYKDSILQDAQPSLLKQPVIYTAVVNPQNGKIVQLEHAYQKLKTYMLYGDYAVIAKSGDDIHGDRFWEKDYNKDSNWLLSLHDGTRTLLPTRGQAIMGGGDFNMWFSPDGQYLIYFDLEKQCHYFSYHLPTRRITDISPDIPDGQLGYEWLYLYPKERPSFDAGIAGWLPDNKGLLVYDNYDIWLLDVAGQKPPVNITGGAGKKNNILFSLLNTDRLDQGAAFPAISQFPKNTLLLRAFNLKSKFNGFYQVNLDKPGEPELLTMGPFYFSMQTGMNGLTIGMPPLKAIATDTWIVQRQSATEAPNYFLTRDFKTFKQLTFLTPHKNYNWLTTELHSFQQLNGTTSQGVLYKPENFDPSKKYPVIISFYERLSDRPYQFPHARYISKPNIFDHPAWMVSHGYLVFTPDIYFTKGQWGPSTVNAIEGAARYLQSLPFVDDKHIGAAGHSNSGRFGYYLLTHSKAFAAMAIGAGTSSMLSGGLIVKNGGKSELLWAEIESAGTGLGNLWENKATWLDHTATLHVDNTTSPVLIFHNKKDGVEINHAAGMFTALRRLGKPAWWLQYDHGGHTVVTTKDLRDFTIRYTQFFDHHLKGAPPPRWMTQGIPNKLKNIQAGFEPDPGGQCAENCSACDKEKYVTP